MKKTNSIRNSSHEDEDESTSVEVEMGNRLERNTTVDNAILPLCAPSTTRRIQRCANLRSITINIQLIWHVWSLVFKPYLTDGKRWSELNRRMYLPLLFFSVMNEFDKFDFVNASFGLVTFFLYELLTSNTRIAPVTHQCISHLSDLTFLELLLSISFGNRIPKISGKTQRSQARINIDSALYRCRSIFFCGGREYLPWSICFWIQVKIRKTHEKWFVRFWHVLDL